MRYPRSLTLNIQPGPRIKEGVGEVHIIVITHSPHEGSRIVMENRSPVAPSDIASDAPGLGKTIAATIARMAPRFERTYAPFGRWRQERAQARSDRG